MKHFFHIHRVNCAVFILIWSFKDFRCHTLFDMEFKIRQNNCEYALSRHHESQMCNGFMVQLNSKAKCFEWKILRHDWWNQASFEVLNSNFEHFLISRGYKTKFKLELWKIQRKFCVNRICSTKFQKTI